MSLLLISRCRLLAAGSLGTAALALSNLSLGATAARRLRRHKPERRTVPNERKNRYRKRTIMSNHSGQGRKATTAALAGLAILFAIPAGAATPASVAAPPDTRVVASMTASGVQVYQCEFDASHRLGWAFKSPLATLYDARGQESAHHSAGPKWQAPDGSTIAGRVLSQAPSQTTGSIPQLLLETRSTASSGALSAVRYVQRLDTVGGVAPTEKCTTEHESGRSPYLARYVFLQ